MTPRRERHVFACAALALWLLYFVEALLSPVVLDDWFQLRYWRDHEFGPGELWTYARHNYFHFNPRIGEVFLAIVDAEPIHHWILTPLIQVALVPIVFAIAFGRWPRATLRDLQLLLVIQIMIWLVIPIPGVLYFYRPFATNYLWTFTLTLALFVPYRLGVRSRPAARPRVMIVLVPAMFALGWIAGMCNEHTGPAAMLAMAVFVFVAWQRDRLRAWMVSGMVGLYIGYPMLFFAPGQSVRYGGLATRETPAKLLADRGIAGCLEIMADFVRESWLGILLFAAALASYIVRRGLRLPFSRAAAIAMALLVTASGTIVVTLFVSPTTTDRVLFASGVLLAAAFSIGAAELFGDRGVRRFVVGACIVLAGYHAARFLETSIQLEADSEQRLALLRDTPPGRIAIVPTFQRTARTRWVFGDDFQMYPWLRDYVGGSLFDLPAVELDRPRPRVAIHHVATRVPSTIPPAYVPTYREWLLDPTSRRIAQTQLAGAQRFTVHVIGLWFAERRPIVAYEVTPDGSRFVDGRPHADHRGHFIRVVRASLPRRVESTAVIGCGVARYVVPIHDGPDTLLPVDETACRGPFTAFMCERDRCWIAGWY
jgi:hypothetical protein